MIRAFLLYTGPDGHSHVIRGRIKETTPSATQSISFSETPAGSNFDWHNAPTTQFVITLSGTLEFTTHGGETFTIHPGDILIAKDTTGTGHKWRLIDDQPWRRAYIVFNEAEAAAPQFIPDP
jgi:quercetin dioxygenase-like cupin family protein